MEINNKMNNNNQSELSECIQKITPKFEECLIRAFKNETLAIHRHDWKDSLLHFDDTVFPIGETMIELRKLQLPWIPDFRINQLKAHLDMFCLDLSLNLGSLTIEGDYEANNASLQSFLPVANVGNIRITFNNIIAKGKVGLFINEDSLLPENYDLVYETSEVDIRVCYYGNDGKNIVSGITKENVEESLGISIWGQLTQTLTELLSKQLKSVVSQFSIWELFGDNQIHLRDLERALIMRSDLIADNLLCAAKDYIVLKSCHEIIVPHFEMIFKGKPSNIHLGSIRTSQGYVKDLTTLTRQTSWSCYEDGRELIVFGYLTLREFKHGYREYLAKYETSNVFGNINMSVYKNRIFVKINHIQDESHCECCISRIQMENIGDIDVDISGLASLGWLSSRIKSWTIGYFRQRILGIQENTIKEAFMFALQRIKCTHKDSDIIKVKA